MLHALTSCTQLQFEHQINEMMKSLQLRTQLQRHSPGLFSYRKWQLVKFKVQIKMQVLLLRCTL